MSDQYAELVEGLKGKVLDRVKVFVTEDAWDLVPDDGKAEVAEAAMLLVECGLLEAMGHDVSGARAALRATIGNWEMAGKIRAAGHVDDFVALLKDGLMEAAEITFKLLGAGLRGLL